ncbi:hypothetical protein [Pseudobacter ginsenosidimutans]|nr:hypothetical protein [Pseudobacter ginsenosidimutans]QEC44585.1 hypothetical protein FSB84_23975 [Pseudobacter ginsenosidimutans]
MMKTKIITFVALIVILVSCSKSKDGSTPVENKEWQFMHTVNIHPSKNGIGLDFYQYKGEQVRILQFEFDDYTTLFFLDSLTIKPDDPRFPISSFEGYITTDNQFFDKKANKVFFPGSTKWTKGDAPHFSTSVDFETRFTAMSAADKNAANYDACLYSFENPATASVAQKTYLFFNFKNNKTSYYVPGNTQFNKKTGTIAELFPNGNTVDWTKIDAACTNTEVGYTGGDDIYFFDFEAKKVYLSARISKTNGNAKMTQVEKALDFSEVFNKSPGSTGSKEPFDFSK